MYQTIFFFCRYLFCVVGLVVFDKVKGLVFGDDVDVADPVLVGHPIDLVRHFHQLRTERCRDELRARHVRQPADHILSPLKSKETSKIRSA